MYNIEKFLSELEEYAPLKISHAVIKNGGYDNSGIIIKSTETVNKILFTLDLSIESVKKAVRLKCDTIVTHHPAIYSPIKELEFDGSSASVLMAVQKKLNVISFHLNLDMANDGIDENLCKGLGGKNFKILDKVLDDFGYGREFDIAPTKLSAFVSKVKEEFSTNRVVVYGNKNAVIKKCASFCGGGASSAHKAVLDGLTDADLIITSDAPHHVIKDLVEKGKSILLLTHYASENYGFKLFYEKVKEDKKLDAFFFEDKRFM